MYSSLPLVGRHLEPFAGLTAMTMYGGHYAPAAAQPGGSRIPPFARARAQRRRCLYRSSVRYGGHPAQLLDVWRRPDLPETPAPVLLFVPGGAWVQGTRVLQGHTLLSHLVKQGWVCLTMDYRVAVPRLPGGHRPRLGPTTRV
jgi:acetyl esterase/lipase